MRAEAESKASLFGPNKVSRKVLQETRKVTEEVKNEAEAHKELGNTSMRAGRYAEAVTHYSKAIELLPSSAIYFSNRSAALLKLADQLNKIEEKYQAYYLKINSLDDAKHAIVLDNRYTKAYLRKVMSLQALERYTLAIEACNEALQIDPSDSYFIETKSSLTKADQFAKSRPMELRKTCTVIPNPNFPIQCEPFDKTGTQKNVKYETEQSKFLFLGDLRALECESYKNTPKIRFCMKGELEAYTIAQKAYCCSSTVERVNTANKALEVSKNCPEAFNILAECAGTIDEALQLFDEGIRAGPLVLSKDGFNDACSTGIWDHHILRGYWRCMFGKGNLLRKIGRYEEALQVFKELMRIDPNYHANDIFYVNFRVVVVDVLMSLKRYSECRELLADTAFFGTLSGAVTKAWTTILLDYIQTGKVHKSLFPFVLGSASKPAPYIFGYKKLPDIPETKIMGYQTTLSNAISYVRYNKKHWDQAKGAINSAKDEYLRALLVDIDSRRDPWESKRIKLFLEKFLHYEPVQNYTKYTSTTLLSMAAFTGNIEILLFAIEKGFDIHCARKEDGVTAMHLACFNGHLHIIKILLDKGASMTVCSKEGFSPLVTAANVGEHQCLSYMLDKRPDLIHARDSEGLPLIYGCMSRTAICIAGVEKCQKCLDISAYAHSSSVDIAKTVRVLVKRGVDVNKIEGFLYGSLLHRCVSSYAYDAMEYLLPLMTTATKNHASKDGKTALHMLVESPDTKGIYLNGLRILATQIDLELKDMNGNTALDVVTKRGDKEAADILIQAGAQPTNAQVMTKLMCTHCKKLSAKLKCCPCHKANYCSLACQKSDWRRHKKGEHAL